VGDDERVGEKVEDAKEIKETNSKPAQTGLPSVGTVGPFPSSPTDA
jgi:hypothetical protein